MKPIPQTPRPTALDLLERLRNLGYPGSVIEDEGAITAYSFAGNPGNYGHPTVTLAWIAHRDERGDPLDTGWYSENGVNR